MDKLKLKLLQEAMRQREYRKRTLVQRIIAIQRPPQPTKKCVCNEAMHKSRNGKRWTCNCGHFEPIFPE